MGGRGLSPTKQKKTMIDILYWFSVLGSLHTFCVIMMFPSGIGIIATLAVLCRTEIEPEARTEARRVVMWLIIIFVFFALGAIFIPSEFELSLIYNECYKVSKY